MFYAQIGTTSTFSRAKAFAMASRAYVSRHTTRVVRAMTAYVVPTEAETLKGRLRDCHRDYVKYIERRNAEANAHEGTIAALTNEIEKIDDDISNVEAYADTLERLLAEL